MRYRAEIDGLRAVAVLPVVFYHAGFPVFSGGFVGVDVFFVISGYLITTVILENQAAGRSVWSFYDRRIRRIVPALFVVCAATIPFAWVWMLPSEFNDYSKSLYTAALSVSNFHFWLETDYFAPATELQPLIHTWSLGVEEQFYVVFPLVLALVTSRRLAIIGLLCAISFVAALALGEIAPAANFYLLPTRLWELGIGALLAIRPIKLQSRAVAEAVSACGIFLVLICVPLLDGSMPYPGWWALPPTVGTLLLLIAATPGTFVGRILACRVLVGIGLISYSLYLWHQPVFAFARMRVPGEVSSIAYIALIGLSLALAYASWRYVETPFRQHERFRLRQILVTFASATAVLVVVGLLGDLSDGFAQQRGSRYAENLTERMRANFGLSEQCDGRLPFPAACATTAEPEIIVWGDSYAMHIVAGIVASNPSAGIVQATKSACGPILGMARIFDGNRTSARKCLAFNDSVKSYIEDTASLRYAVLSSPFDFYMEENSLIFSEDAVQAASPSVTMRSLAATIDWLKSRGIVPVIFSPPPRDGSDMGTCAARSIWLGKSGDPCALSPEVVRAYGVGVSKLLNEVDVTTVDVASYLCDGQRCKTRDDDILVYRDNGHLSYEGSMHLGKMMSFYDRIVGDLTP